MQFYSYQNQRREKFPNFPEQKRSHIQGAIVNILINYFLVILTRDNQTLVSSFVVHVDFSIFIIIASVKVPLYYYWGIYFVKSYHDTWRNVKTNSENKLLFIIKEL